MNQGPVCHRYKCDKRDGVGDGVKGHVKGQMVRAGLERAVSVYPLCARALTGAFIAGAGTFCAGLSSPACSQENRQSPAEFPAAAIAPDADEETAPPDNAAVEGANAADEDKEAVTPIPEAVEPEMPSEAPVREDEFNLDLDEISNIGVAWPNMDSDEPDVRLTGPLEGFTEPQPADGETLPAGDAEGQPQLASGSGDVEDVSGDGQTTMEQGVATATDEFPPKTGPAETGPAGTGSAPILADDGSERRYQVILSGLDDIADAQFKSRFNSFSLLKAEEGKPANIAQINRRMQSDTDLIDRILRAKGYYGAFVRRSVQPPAEGGDGKLQVQFTVRPGSLYTLSDVSLPGMAFAISRAPQLATVFPVKVGDPVDADAITAGRLELITGLGEHGFPFAAVDEPEVTIDHETQTGDLEMVVRSGGYRLFGGVELNEETGRIFTAKHLETIARFDRGDVYQASDVEDLRRAIVATGLVSQVSVTPQDAGDGEHANIAVSATPAPMRTIAGEIGYGTGEGYRLETSWQHRNFFRPEGAVTVSGLLGTKEQAAGLAFRRNNFRRRDNVLAAGISFLHRDYDAYKAKTISINAGLERQSNLIYQKKWAWSIGAELLATREWNYYDDRMYRSNRDFLIGALPVSLMYDSSDDLLDPTKGFRIGARVSPEASWQGNPFTYLVTQVDGSAYMPVSDAVVLAGRVRLGSILSGVDANRIAPSRRFYAGGGASVRGYGYQSIGPRDPDNDPRGGKSLAEFSLEARIRFGVFGVVPFLDAGNISSDFLPGLGSVRYGAGIGMRYYSAFGPIRIDVGTPLNRQSGDSRIAVYVSLGQAF